MGIEELRLVKLRVYILETCSVRRNKITRTILRARASMPSRTAKLTIRFDTVKEWWKEN